MIEYCSMRTLITVLLGFVFIIAAAISWWPKFENKPKPLAPHKSFKVSTKSRDREISKESTQTTVTFGLRAKFDQPQPENQ